MNRIAWGGRAFLMLLTWNIVGCDTDELAFGAPDMAAITVGEQHSCALSLAGAAYCWGNNSFGQLGTGDNEPTRFAVRTAANFTFNAIAAGGQHTCALTTDGRAVCWGRNESGQLGSGDRQDAATPQLVNTPERFASISAGFAHTCALTAAGRAFCWGSGAQGELGTGTIEGVVTTPLPVTGNLVFTQISAGGRHTCALASGGSAYCWGANEVAQLGTGTAGVPLAAPARVDATFTFSNISAGWNHSCGVAPTRTAYCWGENRAGEMGSGWVWHEGVPGQPYPVPVTNYGAIMFTQISAGRFFTCGRRDQGTIYCWGEGTHGQLGNGANTSNIQPQWVKPGPGRFNVAVTDVFLSVDARSESHACGMAHDGRVFCWGNGADGQLGNGEWLTMIALPIATTD